MVSSKIGDGEGHDQTRFASSGVKWGYEIMLANENSNWTCPWTHGGWWGIVRKINEPSSTMCGVDRKKECILGWPQVGPHVLIPRPLNGVGMQGGFGTYSLLCLLY
ncbi:hypothetical protein TNIN_454231 [Trichonephila inaurata madagascariensis]|uniref:Uncharacterized protein n=1 Tax=Trichonephila inaurata madagascariensis TaxID=2747483 RepID=A0A8X6YEF7_9ARAC|nr:hypothetical protein TNIN_454231 [Trichonephila inaurata madagascariensis]